MDLIYTVDYAVLNWIQEHIVCAPFDLFFKTITHLGDGGIFCICLTVLMLCFKKTRKMGFIMAVAIALGSLSCNVILKPLIARIRPYFNTAWNPVRTAEEISMLVKLPSDYSFPSGHTTVTIETACAIFSCRKKTGVAAIVVAVLVGFSRLYLYVHYFTDVLCGALVGIGAAIAGYYIVKALEPRILKAIEKRKNAKKQEENKAE